MCSPLEEGSSEVRVCASVGDRLELVFKVQPSGLKNGTKKMLPRAYQWLVMKKRELMDLVQQLCLILGCLTGASGKGFSFQESSQTS